jgi:hypothetical protein
MIQEHMPIFVSYMKEFADASKSKASLVDSEQLKTLQQQGDWTQVSYYKTKTDVTLEDTEMKEYKAQIAEILK